MNFILGVAVLLVLVLTMGKVGSDDCGFQRERHKLRSPAGRRHDFADLQQPCWTVYDITDWFYTGEENLQRGGPARQQVLELQDVTFTPTRDADGNVLYGMDFRVEPMKRTCGTSLS